MGQAIDALRRATGTVERRRPFELADAVIHLAAIPAPGVAPDATIFQHNMMTTYNVFSAAMLLGLERVVWASSETTFGLPFTRVMPSFAPLTEGHPLLPENSYALAQGLCEEMARQMNRWNPGTSFVGLRISNIIQPDEYGMFAGWQADANIRKWNLWGYVDTRDVAQACRLALEAPLGGCRALHHRCRRYRDGGPEPRTDGGVFSVRAARSGTRQIRDPPIECKGPAAARLRAADSSSAIRCSRSVSAWTTSPDSSALGQTGTAQTPLKSF